MINSIKDFFNMPRVFTVDVYGIGYMSNVFLYKTIKVTASKTEVSNQKELNTLALIEMNGIKVSFPRLITELNNKD